MRKQTLLFIAVVALIIALASADEVQQARELLARFRAVDWDARAVMVKPPALTNDEQWKLRVTTEFDLVALGKPIVPTMIESLRDENRHVRALAAYVLGGMGDGHAAAPLGQTLQSDRNPTVRVYASDALGRLAAKEATPIVEQAATNEANGFVKFSAQVASRRIANGQGASGLREQFVKLYDQTKIASAVVGKPAPEFALTTNGNDVVRLSDFRGKKHVVLLFQLADW